MEENIYNHNDGGENSINSYENSTPPPKKHPALTYILIAVNVLVWLVILAISFFSQNSYDSLILNLGAKINSLILKGEFWRLITSMFLHSGIFHLLANCYSLYYLGTQIESLFGSKRFAVIYIFSGILGSVTSFAFTTSPSVGASGAIFGLMGALLYIMYRKPMLFKTSLGRGIITIVAINLALGFTKDGIDYYAHIGGLIGGFLITGTFFRQNENNSKTVWLSGIRSLIISVFLALAILVYGIKAPMNSVFSMMEELNAYSTEENWDEVEKTAEVILLLQSIDDGTRAEVLWNLVISEAIQEKWDEGKEHANQLIEVHPPSGHYILGILYYDMGEYELAKQELLSSKKAGPEYVDSINRLLLELNSE